MVRFAVWVIRQKEMNRIMDKYSDFEGVDFVQEILKEFNITIQKEGVENLPENPRHIFIANHPFGVIDGLITSNIVGGKYGEMKSIGNQTFFYVPNLIPIIAAVNIFGTSSREHLAELEKDFRSDTPIVTFPAGAVSRLRKWKISDEPWQKSFLTKAISSQRNIIPIYIYGTNSFWYYFVSGLRRMLFIKTNIEHILLPREMFKKRNKTIRVRIGASIPYTTFDKSKKPHEWVDHIRGKLYSLKTN